MIADRAKNVTKPKSGTAKKDSPKPSDPMSDAMKQQFEELDETGFDGEDDDEDEDDSDYLDEKKPTSTKLILSIVGIVVVAIVIVIIVLTRPMPTPLPPALTAPIEVSKPMADPWLQEQQSLYELGIGAEYIDEVNIFDQGNLESFTFRRDFTRQDQPEMFVLPIKISTAINSMTYTRNRAVLDDGMEIYWLEGTFQGRKVVTTIPYSLYQTLAPEGVVPVEVEVVTDANDSVTITHVSALPPTQIRR